MIGEERFDEVLAGLTDLALREKLTELEPSKRAPIVQILAWIDFLASPDVTDWSPDEVRAALRCSKNPIQLPDCDTSEIQLSLAFLQIVGEVCTLVLGAPSEQVRMVVVDLVELFRLAHRDPERARAALDHDLGSGGALKLLAGHQVGLAMATAFADPDLHAQVPVPALDEDFGTASEVDLVEAARAALA